MGETLIVMFIVAAAVIHLGLRYLPRRRTASTRDVKDGSCGSGCGSCGGCAGLGQRHGGR